MKKRPEFWECPKTLVGLKICRFDSKLVYCSRQLIAPHYFPRQGVLNLVGLAPVHRGLTDLPVDPPDRERHRDK